MQLNFGVIGYPIGHSMSPFIQQELFKLSGFDADYDKYEIEPESLADKFNSKLKSFAGFNVTIPHKVDIIPLLDRLDEVAQEYGAVNTVKNENGQYIGYNTDAYGFLKGLEFSKIPLNGRVVIYGFGGAARTIITESLKAGCEVIIATIDELKVKAKTVAEEFSERFDREISVVSAEELTEEYDLFVNASPVGMYPQTEFSPLEEAAVGKFKYIYDIVYNPSETMLIRQAKKAGKISGGGLSMLVCQAQKAQNYWYGAEFNNEQTAEIISKAEKKLKEIFV